MSKSSLPQTRLYVDLQLAAGETVALTAGQAHKLRNVLRCGPGDLISLFNGREGEWHAVIRDLDSRRGSAVLQKLVRPGGTLSGPAVLFAPVKRQALHYLVEKATELGAAALQPVITERTILRDPGLDRLETIARDAAEQSGRLQPPDIRPIERLETALGAVPAASRLLFCDTGEDSDEIAASLGTIRREVEKIAGLLVGPEGGFAPTEREALLSDPRLIPISLGPEVLRTETAVAAGLALLRYCRAESD